MDGDILYARPEALSEALQTATSRLGALVAFQQLRCHRPGRTCIRGGSLGTEGPEPRGSRKCHLVSQQWSSSGMRRDLRPLNWKANARVLVCWGSCDKGPQNGCCEQRAFYFLTVLEARGQRSPADDRPLTVSSHHVPLCIPSL